jgi:protein O-GlcNAc transferase
MTVSTTEQLQARLELALTMHQQGRLEQAGRIYQEILRIQPGHADAQHLLGVIALQSGQPQRAAELIARAIKNHDGNAAYYTNFGNALQQLNETDSAIRSYDRAIALQPDYANAYANRGNALRARGQLEQALNSYDRALALQPDNADTHNNRGMVLQALKRLHAAQESYEQAIAIDPDYAEALNNRGNVLQELHQLEPAVSSYDQAIKINPGVAVTYFNRADARRKLQRFDAALGDYEKAISLQADFAEAFNNRGSLLKELQRYTAALEDFDRAITLRPGYAEAYNNRGAVLKELRQFEAAIDSYDRAIALDPEDASAWFNRGIALQESKNLSSAIASYKNAIAIKPDYAEAYNNLGNVLTLQRRFSAALAHYNRATQLKANYAQAYTNRGMVLQELGQLDAAIASYDQAIAEDPDYAEAHFSRGNALQELMHIDAAIASYERALTLKPEFPFLLGTLVHCKMLICDWSTLDSDFDRLRLAIAEHCKVTQPFPLLAMLDSPDVHKIAAQCWVNAKFPANPVLGQIAKKTRRNKIRIGYFSSDFRDHPVAHLTAELFETHDREKFEVHAFSFGPDVIDVMHQRLTTALDSFVDVRDMSDEDVARLSRAMEIDIAVDLGGFTANSRTGIFALRAAPVQTSYLGYLGTMAADYYDYLLADKTLISPDTQQFYTEKICYLPSYQVNDSKRLVSDKRLTRKELGLPEQGFVFCCFNSTYKLTPQCFAGWMRILSQVEASVLFLSVDDATAQNRLRRQAEAHGINESRLVFGAHLSTPDYRARLRSMDLFLDTVPYNAGTTASDALWMGLPVLTLRGQTFASRYGASLLNAIEMPELITDVQSAYEALAVELASNKEKYKGIKQKLDSHRRSAVLFDTQKFTAALEAEYRAMLQRDRAED